jgi:energy-coupling factor transport system substrate-specific component
VADQASARFWTANETNVQFWPKTRLSLSTVAWEVFRSHQKSGIGSFREGGSNMERLKRDFSTISLVMIPVAIAINIAIGTIIYQLKVPFVYLDSIGTIFVGAIAGPWVGALTGLLTNLVWIPLGNPAYGWYAPVAAVIGLLAGLFAKYGFFRQWWKAILAGFITGLVASLLSAPITILVYGGFTGAGTDAITAACLAAGGSIEVCAFAQSLTVDLVDKTLSFFLVWLIIQALPVRFLDRFPRASALR